MTDRHYVDEEGTDVIVDCGEDISGGSNFKLLVKKPDGTEAEWTTGLAVYQTNYLKYTSQAGDFDQEGNYYLQSYVELASGWKGKGKTASFHIYGGFDV